MAKKSKRNKAAPDTVLERAWKEIAGARYREAGGVIPSKPQARRRRRTTRKFTRPLGMDRAFQRLNKSDAAKLGASRMTAEERSARARKGWETRNSNRRQREFDAEMRHDTKRRAGKVGAQASKRRRVQPPVQDLAQRIWRNGDPFPF